MDTTLWHPLSRDEDLGEAPLATALLGQSLSLIHI